VERCLALLLLTCGACASAESTSLPEALLGRWYYTGSSGGIGGDGLGDDPAGYIVIRSDRTLEHFEEDGTTISTTRFKFERGPTIFSTDPQWVMSGTEGPDVVLTLSDEGRTLSLSENVYDGIGRTYARSR